MKKTVFALIACGLLAFGCSGGGGYGKGSTMSSTVATQAQLDEGNRRINEFKRELLGQGFREASTSSSDSKEQVVLEGRYGALKDLKVTLWTGKRLDMKEPSWEEAFTRPLSARKRSGSLTNCMGKWCR